MLFSFFKLNVSNLSNGIYPVSPFFISATSKSVLQKNFVVLNSSKSKMLTILPLITFISTVPFLYLSFHPPFALPKKFSTKLPSFRCKRPKSSREIFLRAKRISLLLSGLLRSPVGYVQNFPVRQRCLNVGKTTKSIQGNGRTNQLATIF